MENKVRPGRPLRQLLSLTFLLIASSTLFAQAPAIEPCQAAPSPKPGAVNLSGTPTKVNTKATQTIVDASIADDPNLEKLLAPYREKVNALSLVIGRLEGDAKKTGVGAGSIGNLVTDGMLGEARRKDNKNVVFAITNAGGLRKNEIAAGELRASDIFELLPFENMLVTLDITGAQLIKLTQLTTRDAQSGARVQFRWNEQNRQEVIGAKLIDPSGSEREIDANALYRIVTTDYLYKLNSGNYAILQEGKNINWLNVTIRDAVMDFVKAETTAGRPIRGQLDNRFVQVGPGPPPQEKRPND